VLRDEYLRSEQDDAVAAIAWIAAQPWCDGTVGMTGISWGGFNSLQVAARRPPALKAIITVASTDDRYADDMHYMGGCVLMDTMGWGATFLGYLPTPPDPAVAGAAWRAMWRERLEAVRPPVLAWLEHQTRDDYWRQGSVCEDYDAIQCAVYAVGGWADGYSNAIPRLMRHLRCPKKALIGPWGHCFPYEGGPGPLIGYLQETLRWWDHWLKGRATGVMDEPPIRVWMQEWEPPLAEIPVRRGRWVAERAWPDPAAPGLELWLGETGLSPTRTASNAARNVASPTVAGRASSDWCPYGLGPDLATDQREDDAAALVFDSEPLDRPLDTLGAPLLAIDVAADRPVAQLVVRLCDVAPDGGSVRVTYGVLNLTHRDGHERPEPLEPGRSYRVRLALNDCAYAFPAGHRVRVALGTSYWPVVWPAPEPVTLTVALGTGALTLPARRSSAEDATLEPFGPAECAPERAYTVLRAPTRGRQAIAADATGTIRLVSVRDRGRFRLDDIGLIHEGWGQDVHTIREGDPASAVTETRRRVAYERDGWSVRIETWMRLGGDTTAFRLEAGLEAFEDDAKVFTRSWDEVIPRRGV
jgi:putative CocE/NonD family hydrolase